MNAEVLYSLCHKGRGGGYPHPLDSLTCCSLPGKGGQYFGQKVATFGITTHQRANYG